MTTITTMGTLRANGTPTGVEVPELETITGAVAPGAAGDHGRWHGVNNAPSSGTVRGRSHALEETGAATSLADASWRPYVFGDATLLLSGRPGRSLTRDL